MPGERRQQPDHDGRDDDDDDEVDEDDDDHGGRDDDDEDDDDNFHQSVSGAKMNVPMPEPQMAMPGNNFKDFLVPGISSKQSMVSSAKNL